MSSYVKSERLHALPESLRRKLVQARRLRGWSQRDLGAAAGLPQVHISAIETGKVTPRYDTLLDLARVLGQDLLLVPRPLVPAVQALVRNFEHADREAEEGERPLYGGLDDSGEV